MGPIDQNATPVSMHANVAIPAGSLYKIAILRGVGVKVPSAAGEVAVQAAGVVWTNDAVAAGGILPVVPLVWGTIVPVIAGVAGIAMGAELGYIAAGGDDDGKVDAAVAAGHPVLGYRVRGPAAEANAAAAKEQLIHLFCAPRTHE